MTPCGRHRQPTDPDLLKFADLVREVWANLDPELEDAAREQALKIPVGRRVAAFKHAMSIARQSDASSDDRENAAVLAFSIMRVSLLWMQDPSTKEAITLCPACGAVIAAHILEPDEIEKLSAAN